MTELPKEIRIKGILIGKCNYGENAYQSPAGEYSYGSTDPLALDKLKLIAGLPLSFNNFCDIDRLLQTITHIAATFDVNRGGVNPIAIGVKHGNACGAGVGRGRENKTKALFKAIAGDPLALFGGLLMCNFPINEDLAEIILYYKMTGKNKRLLDGIIAPGFDDTAVEMLQRKTDKCRLVVNPALAQLDKTSLAEGWRPRPVRGGFLLQPNYTFILNLHDPNLEKIGQATEEQEIDMLMAKAICDTSNSNTITIVKDCELRGNGVGQKARVQGGKLAILLARWSGHYSDLKGATAASDSFFPAADGPLALLRAGIGAVFSTSGSIKDETVKKCFKKYGAALYLLPDKQARGFFGH